MPARLRTAAVVTDRSGWSAFAFTTAARLVLCALGGLLIWTLLPALLGWKSTVVMSGSMQPRIMTGDIVVSRPVAPAKLTAGQILLVDSPDKAGELRLHRFVRYDTHGELVLRGDANRQDDSTPVKTSAVHGVAALRVPLLGRPVLWAEQHQFGPLVAVAALLALLLRLATWWRPEAEAEEPTDRVNDDDPPRPENSPKSRHRPRHSRLQRRRILESRPALVARLGAATATLLAIGLMTAPGSQAAPFATTTANPTNTMASSSYFSCQAAAGPSPGTAAAITWPFSEMGGGTAVDTSGNGLNGTFTGGMGLANPGPCNSDGGRAASFNGSTGYTYGNASLSGSALAQYSYAIWFKTSTAGGTLMGFSQQQTGVSSVGSYDRLLYMTNAGQLIWEQCPGGTCYAIGSSASINYADNTWHHVVVALGSSSSGVPGMRMYVDGALVAYLTTVTTAPSTNGYLRVGFITLTSVAQQPTNFYFTGYLAFASLYQIALTQAQVTALYGAGGGNLKLEAETWAVTANTAPYAEQGNGTYTWSGTGQLFFEPTAAGNSITTNFWVPTAGTYDMSIAQTRATDYGINTIAIDGTTVGPTYDAWNQAFANGPPLNYGRFTLSAGYHTFKLTVTGKNGASTNYYAGIDYMRLDPVGGPLRFEGENLLPAVSSTFPAVAQYDCCGMTWSNNNQIWFQATSPGNFVVNFKVPATGGYDLSLSQTMSTDYGINTVAIDGTTVGPTFNAYSSTLIHSPLLSYGNLTLSAGTHTLKMTVTGKSASSTNYFAGLDYLLLMPTG